jgi:hypothetical protein
LGSHARSASRPRWSAIGAVPSQAATGPADAVRDTYDIAGATIEANSLWGGKCILVDNRLRLRVDDNPAIEDADRITVEAWVNTLSWPVRAVVCPQGGQQPPLQLQRRLLLVPLRARQPAAVRYRRHARERQLGLYRRELRQGRRAEESASLSQRHARRRMSEAQALALNWTACERHRRSLQRPYRRVPHRPTSSVPTAGSRPPGTT